jgi:hypothetical protein
VVLYRAADTVHGRSGIGPKQRHRPGTAG